MYDSCSRALPAISSQGARNKSIPTNFLVFKPLPRATPAKKVPAYFPANCHPWGLRGRPPSDIRASCNAFDRHGIAECVLWAPTIDLNASQCDRFIFAGAIDPHAMPERCMRGAPELGTTTMPAYKATKHKRSAGRSMAHEDPSVTHIHKSSAGAPQPHPAWSCGPLSR